MNRRRFKVPNGSPTDSVFAGSFGRRSKKSSTSSFDRNKTLLENLERSKRSPGTESLERIKRSKKFSSDSLDRKNSKRSSISDCDLLNNRRRHASNSTSSDMNNSSLEYQYANTGSKPDILDSVTRRSRKPNDTMFESSKRGNDSSLNSSNSLESPARRKRFSNNNFDDSSDGANESSCRRRGSSGLVLQPLSGNKDDTESLDSDSEFDDVQSLIDRSYSQLQATEAVLTKEEAAPDLLQPNDYVRTNNSPDPSSVDPDPSLPDKDPNKFSTYAMGLCIAVAIISVLMFVCFNTSK